MRIIVRFEREIRAREKIWILTRERERAATDENDARINSAVQNTKSGSTDFTHSMGLK